MARDDDPPEDPPAPEAGGDADDAGYCDAGEYVDEEAQKRLWVRAIVPLLQMRSSDPDPSGRVQLAFDLMTIAACERVVRILRSDLPEDRG